MLGIRGGGIYTGVFVAAIFVVGAQFVKDRGRLWLPAEKWRLIFGFLLIMLAFDVVSVAAITWTSNIPLLVVLAGAALIAVLRFVGLWVFLGPLARFMFGRMVKR